MEIRQNTHFSHPFTRARTHARARASKYARALVSLRFKHRHDDALAAPMPLFYILSCSLSFSSSSLPKRTQNVMLSSTFREATETHQIASCMMWLSRQYV